MTTNDSFFAEDQEDDFDLLSYIFKYLRYWYWFVITIGCSLIGAYLYLKQYTPVYKVYTTLLIKDENSRRKEEDVVEEFSIGASKQLENEIAILKSRVLLGKVIDALNLSVSYWVEGRSRDVEVYTKSPIKINTTEVSDFGKSNALYIKPGAGGKYQLLDQDQHELGVFGYSEPINSKYGKFRIFRRDSALTDASSLIKVLFHDRNALISGLIGSIAIAPINDESSILGISIENALTDKGKDILTKLLDEYAFTSLDDKNREATSTLHFIEERLKLITAELSDVEQNVEQYRREKGITDLSSEANLFLQKVEQNDAKINEVDIQLKVLEGVERYVNGAQISIVAPSTLMVNDPVLNSYIAQLSELEVERSKLAQSVQPGNSYLETVNSQMKNVKQAIKENLNNQKNNLLVTKSSIATLNNRLGGSIAAVPKKEREYIEIKRQAGIKENLYLMLLKKREETALSYASTITDSRVVDTPFADGGPIRPDRQNIFMMGLIIGFIIPFGVISIKELMTITVQSKKEIEKKTGLKVFGEIGIKLKEDKGEIIDILNHSFVSEQIRMIRSNMQYLFTEDQSRKARTILVTSSTSGEGKTFLTLNIAASLALLEKRVLILGLDMRKPTINQYLSVSNKVGLSTYLIGRAVTDDIIQQTAIENVYIAPSGPIPPNPSELLANGRLKEFFEDVQYSFDYILVDTPPLGLVTDATLLSTYSDVCFYVIRHGKTPKLYLKNIVDLNKRKIFPSLNLILNGVDFRNSADYKYGYGYGYTYNQKQGYGYHLAPKSLFNRIMGRS